MKMINIHTHHQFDKIPTNINTDKGLVINPSLELLNELGWYVYTERKPVPNNHRVTHRYWTVDENNVAVEQIETELIKPSDKILKTARIFRDILRLHFGVEAETNEEITEEYVKDYFTDKRLANELNNTDALDAITLLEGFNIIKKWTNDGTSWSFPWEFLDETA
jgi:hypothetical protein